MQPYQIRILLSGFCSKKIKGHPGLPGWKGGPRFTSSSGQAVGIKIVAVKDEVGSGGRGEAVARSGSQPELQSMFLELSSYENLLNPLGSHFCLANYVFCGSTG